jgi:uncharacterized protein YaiI (UPF0178 family)
MNIWVDADACPVAIKEILFRAAEREKVSVTFVANQFVKAPPSKYTNTIQVKPGFDIADNEIVKQMNPGDLVVTSDIPLADEVITSEGYALSPRGELFTSENIKQRLNMRDFMDTLRGSGIHSGGPSPLSSGDRQNFANHLDRLLRSVKIKK